MCGRNKGIVEYDLRTLEINEDEINSYKVFDDSSIIRIEFSPDGNYLAI